MSACGSSLRHIFENKITENSPLIDSLSSWNQIRALKPQIDHSFTEIFGELHCKETPNPIEDKWGCNTTEDNRNVYQGSYHKRSDSFSSLNSESLQLCTEGLGSESIDDVEGLKIAFTSPWKDDDKNNDNNCSHKNNYSFKMGEKIMPVRRYSGYNYRKGKSNGKSFPPPISCIGRTGKPSVCFQSYREGGRFVLKEMRIPTHESLHASREDGRLRLCFIQPSDQDEDDSSDVAEEEDNGGGEDEGEKGSMEKTKDDEVEEKENRNEETEVRDDIEKGHS